MLRTLIVVDMQKGVFATPRFDRAGCVARINQLIAAAEHTIFIMHREGDMQPDSDAFDLLPELHQPAGCDYVIKTASDSFWRTELTHTLSAKGIREFAICGCATDYCVDTTIKAGASLGYRITVAADAHTTADRAFASAQQLIAQHNAVWASLAMPGNVPLVKTTEELVLRQGQSPATALLTHTETRHRP